MSLPSSPKKRGQAQLKDFELHRSKSNIKQPSVKGQRSGTASFLMVAHFTLCCNFHIPVAKATSKGSRAIAPFVKASANISSVWHHHSLRANPCANCSRIAINTAMRLSSKGIFGLIADTASKTDFAITTASVGIESCSDRSRSTRLLCKHRRRILQTASPLPWLAPMHPTTHSHRTPKRCFY